jgi:hypothetical protein
MEHHTTIGTNDILPSFSPIESRKRGDATNMTYTQIDVDFDVWKAITTRRTSPEMTENSVLRSLLGLREGRKSEVPKVMPEAPARVWETKGVQFSVASEFRATYKGVEYRATITEAGIEYDGAIYKSVSGAAHAVTGTQVNGWRFWECRRPGQTKWILIDEVFKKAHKRAS